MAVSVSTIFILITWEWSIKG